MRIYSRSKECEKGKRIEELEISNLMNKTLKNWN